MSTDGERRGASDEAVRRLREESRLRIERDRRWRTFFAWCAVATMAGGISLSVLNAHDARLAAEEARAGEGREAAIADLSAARAASLAAIERARREKLLRPNSDREREALRAEAARARAQSGDRRQRHTICPVAPERAGLPALFAPWRRRGS